jgi:hypothetical protein
MLVQLQTGTPFGYLIITGVVKLGFRSTLYGLKSSNLSNNGEVGTCSTAQTLFGFQLIS